MDIVTLVTIIIPAIIASIVIPLYKFISNKYKFRANKVVIGIVDCKVPPALLNFRDFTSYKKAMFDPENLVILHCRNVSYALRYCDWVCINNKGMRDEKLIPYDSQFWENLRDDYEISAKQEN